MDRKLASVRVVVDIQPIANADMIECVVVDGWNVVVKKGEFKPGDRCIYFEIDSLLPIKPEYEFLRKSSYKKADWIQGGEGFRLKTIRLRGQISQGLVIPVPSDLKAEIGDDLTEALSVTKWDPPVSASLRGEVEGQFPSFIRKTDQERAQNLVGDIKRAYDSDELFEVTTKLDGSSCTVYYRDSEIGVCSRNLSLKVDDSNNDNAFIKVARETHLIEAITTLGKNIAVQGELMGPGVQGNREKLDRLKLFVYEIFDIDSYKYIRGGEFDKIYHQLVSLGFTGDRVPELDELTTLKDFLRNATGTSCIEKLLSAADGPSLNPSLSREGIVFKSTTRDFSFKVISNAFLLADEQ